MGARFQSGQAALMLELTNINTFYGETQALFDVTLIAAGRVVALLGANGAGKTTTLRSVLGLSRPFRRIRFASAAIERWPTHRIARAGIGWVPDDGRLCPTLTVARNLAIARKRALSRVDPRGDLRYFLGAGVPHGSRAENLSEARCRWSRSRVHCWRSGPRAARRAEPGSRAENRRRRARDDRTPVKREVSAC